MRVSVPPVQLPSAAELLDPGARSHDEAIAKAFGWPIDQFPIDWF